MFASSSIEATAGKAERFEREAQHEVAVNTDYMLKWINYGTKN